MKKTFGIILGAVVIVVIALAAIPTTRDEIHWLWASHKDDTSSYQSYVKTWSTGRHAAEARRLFEERGWSDAQATSSVQGFVRYVQNHPDGKHVAEAKETAESLQWQNAKAATNSIHKFEQYVRDYPDGRHVTEAKIAVEALRWQNAKTMNTFTSIQQYIDLYPKGHFISEGKARQASLLVDDAPFLAARQKWTEEAIERFISDFPGHKREAEARSLLKDMEGRDIVDLVSEKKIEVQSQGNGIETVSVKVRRLVPYPVVLRIPVGTFFISSNNSSQNMVATAESKHTLRTDQWESLSPSVACANRPRDIPDSSDSFSVRRSPNQAELERLMPLVEKAGVGFAVRQAAVWIVTDDADYSDLGTLVSTPANMPFAFGGTRVINESDAVRAMQICDEAGINVTKKAIWRDRRMLLDELKDDPLKKWLQEKSR